MGELINTIIFIGFVLALICFGIGFYLNIIIYYSERKDKYPSFPILNPLAYSSYELMFNSMFKLDWKIQDSNKNLKKRSNDLRRISAFCLLFVLVCGILSLIIK